MKTIIILAMASTLGVSAAVVDHASVDGVAGYPQSMMDAIGTQRWFFSHASVGGNMIDGINALHTENPARYQLESYSVTFNSGGQRAENPPAPTIPGRIYECNRGNPGWAAKFAIFSNSVAQSGWRSTAVDAVMDKLCYIDPTANAAEYIALMGALEARHPTTVYVYITMPLTTDEGADNVLRNEYNTQVRQHCIAHEKLLFDLADIESHDTNGTAQTFVSGGVTNQKLWSGYASDDGHLDTGGQGRAALGWYAVGAQIAVPEPAVCSVLVAMLIALRTRRQRRSSRQSS